MASKYQKLAGTHVFVIGGSSGIGFAVAEGALASGAAKVTISSSSPANVASAVQQLKQSFPHATIQGYACDLSKPTIEQDLTDLFAHLGDERVDHIVLSAGDKPVLGPLAELTYEKIILAGQVRFVAAALIAKVGSRYLAHPGTPRSSIIFTTGTSAYKPPPDWSIVAGYFGGVHGLIRGLAVDLKPFRVNVVCPGMVATDSFWDKFTEGNEEVKRAAFENGAKASLTGRVARVEDLAESYLYLMKDQGITGTVIDTNSGATLL